MAVRLLIVTTVPETLATILRHQPRALARSFDVWVATSPGMEIDRIKIDEGVEVHAIPMTRGMSPFKDVISMVRMIRLLRSLKPDIVHSFTPKAGLITMCSAWLCQVPVRIHTFTGLVFPAQMGLKQRLLVWIDRLICFCATRILPEGEGVRADLQRFGITGKPLCVVGHGNIAGVDTLHYSNSAFGVQDTATTLRNYLGIGPDDFVFCFIGRLNRDKGISELIQAFMGLSGSAHLIVVGAIDKTAPVERSVMNALQAHERIHELGFMEDIRPALSVSNVLVLPSYREGFPNAVLQAGAMQRPVIATDVNGSNEIIEPGFNGWLVPPRQVQPLQEAMQNAVNVTALALQRMGIDARRRILERFEQADHWQRMAQFYQECINQVEG